MTVVGVSLVTGGTLTVPDFALFLLVGTRVFDPLAVAIMNYSELMMCGMSGERICTLLDEPEMAGSGDAPSEHEIRFDHVSFGYGEKEVLHDVSARLEPGNHDRCCRAVRLRQKYHVAADCPFFMIRHPVKCCSVVPMKRIWNLKS